MGRRRGRSASRITSRLPEAAVLTCVTSTVCGQQGQLGIQEFFPVGGRTRSRTSKLESGSFREAARAVCAPLHIPLHPPPPSIVMSALSPFKGLHDPESLNSAGTGGVSAVNVNALMESPSSLSPLHPHPLPASISNVCNICNICIHLHNPPFFFLSWG